MKQQNRKMHKSSTFVRVVALFLAGLMVLGAVAFVVSLFITRSYAAADDTKEIRVGLSYGVESDQSFPVIASGGFLLGILKNGVFSQYASISSRSLRIAADGNLRRDGSNYILSASQITIGGFHIESVRPLDTAQQLADAVAKANTAIAQLGLNTQLYYAFPCRHDGKFYVRIGDFSESEAPKKTLSYFASVLPGGGTVVGNRDSAISLIDTDCDKVAFEIDTKSEELVIFPRKSADLLSTPAGNMYKGHFVCSRNPYGVSVGSVVDLETYISGVIPYEVGADWPTEALKAFAVCVRGVGLSTTKHQKDGFDVCAYSCCQAYRGEKKVTEHVRECVRACRGEVMTWNGKICTVMYSAVTGSCTIDANDLYNYGDIPYLRAVSTPWEDYASHPMGLWAYNVSGQGLSDYLRTQKGCTMFDSPIVSVHIDKMARNSTYVDVITVKDRNGHTKTVTGTYNVYALLSGYLNCANFMIFHNGMYQGTTFECRTAQMLTANGTVTRTVDKTTPILTANGIAERNTEKALSYRTAGGKGSIDFSEYDLPDVCANAVKKAKAGAVGNETDFVFFGKGWGHGCGLSQWGAMNLADLGYGYRDILNAYFTDVRIVPYDKVS